ncbi:condensation domain-containing protein, partial [Fulvivirga kasyanovii]|uniref:condensation domain-containing protein n=1 Tax=Fulvivirga kasyanovii TaxID=396812 RepID=UPI0031D2CED1
RDYAHWQHEQLQGEQLQSHSGYWHGQFFDGVPVLDLPTDHARPSVKKYEGSSAGLKLDKELLPVLQEVSKQEGASLFMVLQAAVYALLYRYTGQEDIVLGTPVSGREHHDLEGQIGFYVNTLALRTRFSGEEGFVHLLDKVKETTLEGYNHQVYPFDRLVDELDLSRDMSRSPLFDVMVSFSSGSGIGESEQAKGLSGIEV